MTGEKASVPPVTATGGASADANDARLAIIKTVKLRIRDPVFMLFPFVVNMPEIPASARRYPVSMDFPAPSLRSAISVFRHEIQAGGIFRYSALYRAHIVCTPHHGNAGFDQLDT